MTGDPKECRKRAARYADLAAKTKSNELKVQFGRLCKSWLSLADELERTEVLIIGFTRKESDTVLATQSATEATEPPGMSPAGCGGDGVAGSSPIVT